MERYIYNAGQGELLKYNRSTQTAEFYDRYWPENIPDLEKNRQHVLSLLPGRKFKRAFEGGCGSGVCSLALSEIAEQMVSVDISPKCIETAFRLAKKYGRDNIEFKTSDLTNLKEFQDGSFDLVFSWGVIHHTSNPNLAFKELNRILQTNGVMILAVYHRTVFSFVHDFIRKDICLKLPPEGRRLFVKYITFIIETMEKFVTFNKVRADNTIEGEVEDWFFVPERHPFKIKEMEKMFKEGSLVFELLVKQTGRFRTTSNFIVRGTKL